MICSKIVSLFHIKSSSSTKEPTPGLGYSTCFSWNPHTLAVNSLDSFLGVANRESRPLRWRGFLHLVPTVLRIDAFCTNCGFVTVVVPDKNWRNFFFILLKLNEKLFLFTRHIRRSICHELNFREMFFLYWIVYFRSILRICMLYLFNNLIIIIWLFTVMFTS